MRFPLKKNTSLKAAAICLNNRNHIVAEYEVYIAAEYEICLYTKKVTGPSKRSSYLCLKATPFP